MSERFDVAAPAATVWDAASRLPPAFAAALWAYLPGLFDARDLPSLRTAALDVRHVIPGSNASFTEVDRAGGVVITLGGPPAGDSPQALASAYARLRHQHPVLAHYDQVAGDLAPLAISDVADEAAFHASELYASVFREAGVRDQLVIPVPLRHELATAALSISRDEWGFTGDEHVAATIIQRALRVTHGTLCQRGSARTARGVTSDLLARSGVQVCVVDRFGEIVGLDGAAVHVDPVTADAISRVARVACATRGSQTAGDSPVLAEFKITDASGEPLALQLLASSDGEFWPVTLRRASSNTCPDRLVERGLTRRQAEVMALLLNGRSTAAAALELGISPRTAEKHIVLACQALGVHTRTDALVALASGAEAVRA